MRAPRRMLFVLVLSLLLSLLPAFGPGAVLQASADMAPLELAALPAGTSPEWWSQVQEDIRQSEYEITWQEKTGLPDLPAAYQAPNRAQGFRTYFTPNGIRVVPRMNNEPGDLAWILGLSLIGYASGESISLTEEAALNPDGNHILSHRGGITEQYTNASDGLRHEINLSRFYPQRAAGAVQVKFALSGRFVPSISDDGQSVDLASPQGGKLRYGELGVWDARGYSLPARFLPTPEGFSVRVEVSSANFPLTVTARLLNPDAYSDGLGLTPDWIGESNQAGAMYGVVIGTIGDVNGDGYSDIGIAAYKYDNGQADEGRVFVYYGSPVGLGLAPDWIAEGDQAGAWFGYGINTAGDVNGDGYADLVIGSYRYDNGQVDEGRAFLYYGSASGLHSTPDWTAEGDQTEAVFSLSLGTAGDVNRDGYSDVIIGAPYSVNGQVREGRAFVWYGSSAGLGPSGNPTNADWIAECNQSYAEFGYSVGTAGDVNGDGYPDVIVGAHAYGGGQYQEGAIFLYYGSATGLSTSSNWSWQSNQAGALLGQAAVTAGDVNGDGYADVIVGARHYDGAYTDEGAAFIFLGSALGLRSVPDWTATSGQAYAEFGFSASTAGDLNGDGYADVVIGAWLYSGNESNEGKAYVFYGSPSGPSLLPAWTMESNQAGAQLGGYTGVSTAGDVNGDGYSDLLLGASCYDNGQTDEGRAYLYLGSAVGLGSTPAWTSEGNQTATSFGAWTAPAGDVNGDGYADVVLTAPQYDNGQTDEGAAFLYLGSAGGLSTAPDWADEGDQSSAEFGVSAGMAGDVNGDGYGDMVVGARYYDSGETDEGRVYLYYGSAAGLSPTPNWIAEGNQVNASFGRDVVTAGDVNGDGCADVLVGAPYYSNGETEEGRAYLYLGSPSGLGASPDWTAECNVGDSYFGWWLNTAGDINGDGYSDVVIGAPRYSNVQLHEGAAFVYHGSAAGLSASPDWQIESNQLEARLGYAVDTAGDVNGDGYADVLVGAPYYDYSQADEGMVFAYYGSAAGLYTIPDWTMEINQADAALGLAVATAGDVNGDGYADIVVGAYTYSNGQSQEGAAYLYHGSATGPGLTANWMAEGNQAGALFGDIVATAGDVNGDGYADVIIGAPYYDNGQTDEGQVYVYYGNAGDGLDLAPEQLRTDDSAPIAQLGMSDSGTAVQLRLTGRMPLGREEVKLQWQVAPLGMPFTATGIISGTSAGWTDVLTTGIVITQNVTGLTPEAPYHWRVRLLYKPGNRLGQPAGRWVHIPWNSWTEEDFRTWTAVCEPVTGVHFDWQPITPTVGEVVTFTGYATGTEPLAYRWDMGDGTMASGAVVGHVYTAQGQYTVILTVTNGCSQQVVTGILTVVPGCEPVSGVGFSWEPLTPTVGAAITFTGQATGTAPLAYSWDLGDGTGATGIVVTHSYGMAGSYTVTLTVTNACGVQVLQETIPVAAQEWRIYLPSMLREVGSGVFSRR